MTYSCKDVLNHLREISGNQSQVLSLSFGPDNICCCTVTQKHYDYTKYAGEFDSIISELVRNNYLEYSGNHMSFSLTFKGLHPYALVWEELKSFLIRSFAVPIVISVITTIITLYIKGEL